MGIAPCYEQFEKANRSRGRDAKLWGLCKQARQAAANCSAVNPGTMWRPSVPSSCCCFLDCSGGIRPHRQIGRASRDLRNGLSPADRVNQSYNLEVSTMSESRKQSRGRGVAAVEFALVAPVFLVMALGIIEVGRMMMVEQILVNATNLGARAATMDGSTTASVQTLMANYLTSSSISGSTQTISPDPSTASSGTAITVTVTVPSSSVSWTGSLAWGSGKTLSATAVMVHE